MSLREVGLSLCVALASVVSLPALADQQGSQPAAAAVKPAEEIDGGTPHYIRAETPEERMQRIGSHEDPGLDPDPQTVYFRFGRMFKIEKFEKSTAKYDGQPDGYVRPFAAVNVSAEIYQENDKYVWVWLRQLEPRKPEDKAPAALTPAQQERNEKILNQYKGIRGEFSPLDPPSSNVHVGFAESSAGLPTSGSFRNGLAVADMNEDGHIDLVLPPQRGFPAPPEIYLGDGTGKWKYWDIGWQEGFNYGTVATGDFNKDKHVDLAFAIHQTGIAVYLGDGKGHFTKSSQGLPTDFPTRRIVVTDVDSDGWLDVVGIGEGPITPRADEDTRVNGSNFRAYLNRDKGRKWEGVEIAPMETKVSGDWIGVGNFNGDKYPDFYAASIYFGSADTLFLSNAAKKWSTAGAGDLVPWISYYCPSVAGRFSGGKVDDLAVTFFRSWPDGFDPKVLAAPPLKNVVGIDTLTFGAQPKRTSIIRWEGRQPVRGIARGDFDGDGKLDLAFTRDEPRKLEILLGDGAGGFRRATADGVSLLSMVNYDLVVADVNEDKKPDLIVMYESDERTAFE
ncbi:MAG TPA: VCBS repeat-containing protein [Thermoanaerobaculia bacterium]|nr:VCBS repeat-containing protein [Thermoanaerobaculia bacterium]